MQRAISYMKDSKTYWLWFRPYILQNNITITIIRCKMYINVYDLLLPRGKVLQMNRSPPALRPAAHRRIPPPTTYLHNSVAY